MSNEQRGILFTAIYKFQLGEEIDLDFGMDMAFAPFKNQFIRDNNKYKDFIELQREKGIKSSKSKKRKPNQPNPTAVDSVNQTQPVSTESTYNDSVNDSVNDSKSDNKNDKKKKKVTAVKIPQFGYLSCIDFWLKEVHPGWQFNAVSGKSLKSVIKKIEVLLISAEKEINEDSINSSFQAICRNLPDWFKDKDLQVIDQKFNEIIEQIKNKKNGSPDKTRSIYQKTD